VKRPTIADIARAAGVSKGAVSYALNGRPGVSAVTRSRIQAVADEMGFTASSAARELSGSASYIVGLALPRPAGILGMEPFYMELITGLEEDLSAHSYSLLLQLVAIEETDTDIYRRWWGGRRVDGVLVCDLRQGDRRVAVLETLPLPAVAVGPPHAAGSLPAIWSDDGASLVEAVEYLAALGHRQIARIAGLSQLVHTEVRTAAFTLACRRLNLVEVSTVSADYTGESGAQATRRLLSQATPPTALVYDNDIMAVAGLAVALEMGLSVPGDLSIIAWDDSPICRLVHPPLSALTRDIAAYGRHAARLLRRAMAGEKVESVQEQPARLRPRGSTGPVRG
jgi:DNA-binding LacI/PurR family transcriptional regulator